MDNFTKNIAVFILGGLCGIGIVSYTNKPAKSVITENKKQVKDTETNKTITKVKSPNGEIKTVTTINTKSKTKSELQKESIITKDYNNVSLLGGYSLYDNAPVYGLSYTRQLYGPFTYGIWGLYNGKQGGAAGISLGGSF